MMSECCHKDGHLQALNFFWYLSVRLHLYGLGDWFADRKRKALLLRHPWMGKRAW